VVRSLVDLVAEKIEISKSINIRFTIVHPKPSGGKMSNTFVSNVTFEAKPDGPKTSLKFDESIDAYDRCDYEIQPTRTQTIELQPANSPEQIRFLLLWRKPLDQGPKPDPMSLTYKINGKGEAIPLDNQHILMGYGVFKMFAEAPKTLVFTNKQNLPAAITVVVGRNQPQTISNPPKIDAFNPVNGPVNTQVTITGSGFTGVTGVLFNNTPSQYQVVSDTEITATVPQNPGDGKIWVINAAGRGGSPYDFNFRP
jgi:IPT/TIG domain